MASNSTIATYYINNILPLLDIDECDREKLVCEAIVLDKELILKERETQDLLKELEFTKRVVQDLKSKLEKEEAKVKIVSDFNVVKPLRQDFSFYPSSSPGLVLMELKQAKSILTKTMHDRADRRTFIELLNEKLAMERIELEKTRERLILNCWKISSIDEELNQTNLRLDVAKCSEIKHDIHDPLDIRREIQRQSSEAEHFRKIGEAAKSEILRITWEIEQTKMLIRSTGMRLEAYTASEAVALADINALSGRDNEGILLSFEEYNALLCKAGAAEEQSEKRVLDAMLELEEANLSIMYISEREEKARKEVIRHKKALNEAVERVEAANREKVAVEEALRKSRPKGHKRRPSSYGRCSQSFELNRMNLENNEEESVSVRQIMESELLVGQESKAGILKERKSVPFDNMTKQNGKGKSSLKRKKPFAFSRVTHFFSKIVKK